MNTETIKLIESRKSCRAFKQEEISKEEARNIKFWNYYRNENAPERIAWGQGLHRYITDIQAASILKDIADLKIGTEDEELAREFLTYFCKINSIDSMVLPMREGVLVKK